LNNSVGTTFKGNISITSFDELQYLKVNGIASNAFNGCTSLKTIHLPDSCTNIGGSQGSINTYSFNGCTSLEYIYGAENVKMVNGMAFSGCSKLKSINLKNVETLWESPFEKCPSLISIGDLSNITYLGYGSLRIPNITSFNLSKKCKNIGNVCFFADINLESVGDLSGVEQIGRGAFAYCTKLKYLKFIQTIPPSIGTDVFNGTTFNIYVQDTCIDTYKNATNWSAYASRIKQMSTFTIDFPNG